MRKRNTAAPATAHDPEGHLWYFGSYDPWQPEQARKTTAERKAGGMAGFALCGL